MSTGTVEVLDDLLPEPGPLQPDEIAARSPLELFWRRLKHDRVALVALAFIGLLVLIAILAGPLVSLFGAHPPNELHPEALQLPFGEASGPSGSYLFGTDGLGRDVFSRTLYGARVSLLVAFIASALVMIIGVTLGMVAGYYRGWVDSFLARVIDVMLAFPVLLLALGLGAACALKGCLKTGFVASSFIIVGLALMALPVLIAAVLQAFGRVGFKAVTREDWMLRLSPGALILVSGIVLSLISGTKKTLIEPGLPVVIFVITISGWPYVARLIRGQVLSLREKEFVEAARSLGASDTRIIFKHILPNLVAPIIVYTTLLIPTNILFEAALSFLGVGVQPPTASWGAMIADAQSTFTTAWWYMLFPGVALVLTVLAFNLVGDGLQDALNPKTSKTAR